MSNLALDRWTPKDDKSLTEILGLEDENTSPVGDFNGPRGSRLTEVNLRIVAAVEPEFPDDLSTIDNDTLNGYLPPPPPPAHYDGIIYHPESPHKVRKDDEDDDTMPETPTKYSLLSGSYTKDMDSPCGSRSFLRILIGSLILGMILLAAIAVMSISLYQIRHDQDSSSGNTRQPETMEGLQDFASNNGFDYEIPDFGITVTPVAAPTNAPQAATAEPQQEETPVAPPTTAPVEQSLSPSEWILYQLSLATPKEFFALGTLEDPSTLQYQVVQWLASDPSLKTYTLERLVQRYALATVYASFTEPAIVDTSQTGPWMTYTDECQWPLSRISRSLCGEDSDLGIVREIYLEDMGFNGTLSSEIGLLSGLHHLYLTSNRLRGSIPTEIGYLTELERVNLPRNSFDGPIPTEFGELVSLGLLSVGNNALVGNLPSELGQLERLGTLRVNSNNLEGPIPVELANLSRLSFVALDNNAFTGPLPEGLAGLTSLTGISLEGNNLTGALSPEICALASLQTATVDCDRIQCSCCEGCDENFIPFPTAGEEGNATSAPDDVTTEAPSAAPSTCGFIGTQRDCYDIGEAIDFSLRNCDPADDDLLALVDVDDFDENGLKSPLIWTLACAEAACNYVVTQDTLFLEDAPPQDITMSQWPYKAGRYRLLFLRMLQPGAARPLAESTDFSIAEDCLAL